MIVLTVIVGAAALLGAAAIVVAAARVLWLWGSLLENRASVERVTFLIESHRYDRLTGRQ